MLPLNGKIQIRNLIVLDEQRDVLVDERKIADFVDRQPVRVFGELVGGQTPGPDVSGADVEIEGSIDSPSSAATAGASAARTALAAVVAASPARQGSDDQNQKETHDHLSH